MKKKRVKEENMEFNPYEVDKLSRVPSWLKIFLLKYWAAAAASFLLFGITELGFNIYVTSEEAQAELSYRLIIMLGLFLALFTNYVIRPIVRLMFNRRDNTYKYNLINCKGIKSFGLAIVYNMIMSILICIVIVKILSPNGLVFDPFGTTGGIGIEPFTVGFIYLFIDGIFLLIKYFIIKIYNVRKYNKQIKSNFKFVATEEN